MVLGCIFNLLVSSLTIGTGWVRVRVWVWVGAGAGAGVHVSSSSGAGVAVLILSFILRRGRSSIDEETEWARRKLGSGDGGG
ncbi:hypothetical protein WG66_005284 [Moniliophthora roreri]|nr:hypothetical protein WG66_005284 [Moniliophthora roreri]